MERSAPKVEEGIYYADTSASTVTESRQGHLYCGFMCDMRRAVMIVNLITIGMALSSITLVRVLSRDDFVNNYDDDFTKFELQSLGNSKGKTIAYGVFTIACALVGATGAFIYDTNMVLVGAAYHSLNTILKFFPPTGFWSIVVASLLAYPHFPFIVERRRGIMTRENYPNEMHSCCCV